MQIIRRSTRLRLRLRGAKRQCNQVNPSLPNLRLRGAKRPCNRVNPNLPNPTLQSAEPAQRAGRAGAPRSGVSRGRGGRRNLRSKFTAVGAKPRKRPPAAQRFVRCCTYTQPATEPAAHQPAAVRGAKRQCNRVNPSLPNPNLQSAGPAQRAGRAGAPRSGVSRGRGGRRNLRSKFTAVRGKAPKKTTSRPALSSLLHKHATLHRASCAPACGWWGLPDLNREPAGYEPVALTIELRPRRERA